MHPVLFNIGNITLYTYGLFTALGFITAIYIAKQEAKRIGENTAFIVDLGFYIIVMAVVGARCFYVFTNIDLFLSKPLEIFQIWNGGLTFYGGFISAAIFTFFYLSIKKMDVWKTGDIFAPALAAGHCVGRMGCFFAGCCYGSQTDILWAVTFENENSLAPLHQSLHPTQIYSVIGNFILFIFLMWFRRFKKFDGQLFWTYVFIYGLMRSFIEIFRGDFRGGFFLNTFSVSQTIGLIMSIVAVVMLLILQKKQLCRK